MAGEDRKRMWNRWALWALALGLAWAASVQVVETIHARHPEGARLACAAALAGAAVTIWLVRRRVRHAVLFQGLFWRWLLIGLTAIHVMVVLSLGGTSAARHVWRASAATYAACLVWLADKIPLWSSAIRCPAVVRMGRTLEIVLFNVCLFLLLGESSLRAWNAWCGTSPLIGYGMEAWRMLPSRTYGEYLSTNSRGFPGRDFVREKTPGVYRLAALGDSFAVGVVPLRYNFLTLLDEALPHIEVYNYGVPCIGPREYYHLLQTEVWPFRPDLVLVCFFVGNDITDYWPLPSERRMELASYRLYIAGRRLTRLAQEWYSTQREPRQQTPIAYAPVHISRETFLFIERERLKVCRTSCQPLLARSWEHTLEYLERIQRACQRQHTPLALVVIPDEFQTNPLLLQEMLHGTDIDERDIDLTLPQRTLAEFCRTRGIPYLDLLPVFAGTTDTYVPSDTHWNVKGNQLAAAALARWVPHLLQVDRPVTLSERATNSAK
ncbi:MAG: hypothetical protein C4296_11270 [Gemmataceae bacterium]